MERTSGRRRVQFGGLWRHRDFMRLWISQAILQFGSMSTGELVTALLDQGEHCALAGRLEEAETILTLGGRSPRSPPQILPTPLRGNWPGSWSGEEPIRKQ